jgi:hypothetical protein
LEERWNRFLEPTKPPHLGGIVGGNLEIAPPERAETANPEEDSGLISTRWSIAPDEAKRSIDRTTVIMRKWIPQN